MSESNPSDTAWQQCAMDITGSLDRMLKEQYESWRILRTHLLRAQAEVLKGLLAVVESRMDTADEPLRAEKIPVD